MKMNPYLSFKGDCEAAFKYYEQHLGGEMGDLFRYGGIARSQAASPPIGRTRSCTAASRSAARRCRRLTLGQVNMSRRKGFS